MTVLSHLSATSSLSIPSKPSADVRFDSSVHNTSKTGSPAEEPAYVTLQAGVDSTANNTSTASAIETIKAVNAALIGTTKQAKDDDIPPTVRATARTAETTVSPAISQMPIPLTQTTQPIAIDSKSRQEPNDSSSVPSYVRSDSVSVGDRGAEQTTTEMSSNISMIPPRQSEIPTAQQIRDIATAETAAVTTYADILAQQKQGLSAQANQNPLQVVKLLK